jgi:hypothetical protein
VFVNVLPLRFRTTLTSKFNEVLQETKKAVYTALEKSAVPYQVVLNE